MRGRISPCGRSGRDADRDPFGHDPKRGIQPEWPRAAWASSPSTPIIPAEFCGRLGPIILTWVVADSDLFTDTDGMPIPSNYSDGGPNHAIGQTYFAVTDGSITIVQSRALFRGVGDCSRQPVWLPWPFASVGPVVLPSGN